MTHRARVLARRLKEALSEAQALQCRHSVVSWGLCTAAGWLALVETGDVCDRDATEWRDLCGIPTAAALNPLEGAPLTDIPEPKGRPS